MTTLSATAVISAVDRASAVFARVGANARALSGRFSAAAGGISRFGQAATLGLGMPAAMAGAFAARGEYEVDRLTRLMQAAGELTEAQRKTLTASAFDAAVKTGSQTQEIIRGLREVILGGFGADEAAASAEMLAKVAKTNATTVDKVAEDGITMANALGFAMGTATERADGMRKALEYVSVVQAKSPESWEGLTTALKYAAPVANALKVDINELGAALSMLAFSGFKGEESGTALRTILTRMVAPTKAAREQIRAAGIELSEIADVDLSKIGDMTSLEERLRQAGLGNDADGLGDVLKRFADPSKFDGLYEWNDALMTAVASRLGIGKGDAQDRGILQKAIQAHVSNATNGVNLEKFFTGIKDLPIPAMKDLFGLQRISQAEKLREKLQEIVTLPSGERISAFRRLAREMNELAPGAIDRRFLPINDGYSQAIDKIGAAFGNIRHQIFESGFGQDLTGLFERLSSAANNLAKTDPETLRKIGWAIAGIAATPALGFAASGIVALGSAFNVLARGLLAVKAGEGVLATLVTRGGLARAGLLGAAAVAGFEIYENWDKIRATLEDPINVRIIWPELPAWLKGWIESVGNATSSDGYSYQHRGRGGGMVRISPFKSAGPETLQISQRPRGGTYVAPPRLLSDVNAREYKDGLRLIREKYPDAGMQRVDVKGRADVAVDGTVTGTVNGEITVRYDGPVSGPRTVPATGRVAGKLNRGESSMDIESGGQ